MVDHRMEKLANLIVNYSTAVKPGDKVWIRGEVGGSPLSDGNVQEGIAGWRDAFHYP